MGFLGLWKIPLLLMDGTCKLEIETSLLLKIAKRQGQEHKPFAFKSPPYLHHAAPLGVVL
jgi:hypothetical protein